MTKDNGANLLQALRDSEIKRGALQHKSGARMATGCFHRKSGACGGCYAAHYWAVEALIQGASLSDVLGVLERLFPPTKI